MLYSSRRRSIRSNLLALGLCSVVVAVVVACDRGAPKPALRKVAPAGPTAAELATRAAMSVREKAFAAAAAAASAASGPAPRP